VLVVKRRFFGCGFAHGPSLDSDKCGASVRVIGDWLDFDSSPRSTRRGEIPLAGIFCEHVCIVRLPRGSDRAER
jgi:hypothetical protein